MVGTALGRQLGENEGFPLVGSAVGLEVEGIAVVGLAVGAVVGGPSFA